MRVRPYFWRTFLFWGAAKKNKHFKNGPSILACTAGASVCFFVSCRFRSLRSCLVLACFARSCLALSPLRRKMTFITRCPGGKKLKDKSQERLLRRLLRSKHYKHLLKFVCEHSGKSLTLQA